MLPFLYPQSPHVRRHGPTGYADYSGYRSWLRDEFSFRCVYCLKREQWDVIRGTFHLDHFLAQVHDQSGILDYDNLLYACISCNLGKGDKFVPNPCDCMLNDNVVIEQDGSITGTTPDAKRLIGKLGLDGPDYREFRTLLIGCIQLAKKHDPNLFHQFMKYPEDLPNLGQLKPPEGNSRPAGIPQSCWALRDRGELPDTY
jgi:hypothetical protein